MADAYMVKAKALIDQRRYTEARKVLAQTSDPRSLDWIDKIDGILLRHPEQTKSSHTGLFAVVAAIVIAFIAIGLFFKLSADGTTNARYSQLAPQANAALSTFCATNTRLGSVYCDEYANNTIDADRSRIDEIILCGDMNNPIIEGKLFASCLVGMKVPLPP